MIASIPPYQRDARSKGIPQLGAGAIYPVPESDLIVDAFELPDWYERCYALDVGLRVTAAVWGARDPETDILYLWAEYRRETTEPALHVQAIHSKGRWIPGVVDPAAHSRGQKDGDTLLDVYRDIGLDNLTKARNAVEGGLLEVWTRMSTGRLKIFPNMVAWLSEFRLYRRNEKGDVVKENDHLMDATRYLVLSGLDVACQKPIAMVNLPGRARHVADYNPHAELFKLNR
jgi:hypothetical protein